MRAITADVTCISVNTHVTMYKDGEPYISTYEYRFEGPGVELKLYLPFPSFRNLPEELTVEIRPKER